MKSENIIPIIITTLFILGFFIVSIWMIDNMIYTYLHGYSRLSEPMNKFCQYHNMNYSYSYCFKIEGNKLIKKPIEMIDGNVYFVEENNGKK